MEKVRRSAWIAALTALTLATATPATMVRQEWWKSLNLSNQAILDYLVDPIHPVPVPDLEVVQDVSYYVGSRDYYLAKFFGWVTVPETGTYQFHYACDDRGMLYVSQDEEMAHAVEVAYVTDWCGPKQWNKMATQHSAPMELKKGQVMAVMAFMLEASGGDNMDIGWTGPGLSGDISSPAYLTDYISCIRPTPPEAACLDPETEAVDVPLDAALSWAVGKFAAAHDVYLGAVFGDVRDASREDPRDVLVSQGQPGTTYELQGMVKYGQTYYWRVDEVNAPDQPGIYKGKVWSFTSEPYAYPVKPVRASASSSMNANMGPEKTIDGSGLTGDLHSTDPTMMWLSLASPVPTWIQYDFDQPYKLHQMWVWNSNQVIESIFGFGTRTATIQTSLDGTVWTDVPNVPEFAQALGEEGYAHDTTVDLGGVRAKYVRLTLTSSWNDNNQAGLSEVRFFYVPVHAFGPQPASGTTDVALDTTLHWRLGREAAKHRVYLSTDPDAVAKGTALVQTVTDQHLALSAFSPEYDRTYTWKVNEVNDAAVTKLWEGPLWSFSTQTHCTVEDFESYDDTCNRIFFHWIDGFGHSGSTDCRVVPNSGNGTGSTVGNTSAPFAERTIVHGGKQSMPLVYDTAGGKALAEAERSFDAPQDWTAGGAKTLVLYFYGDPGNTEGQLYMKVNGVKVLRGGDAGVMRRPYWTPWNVDLTSLGGVNLKAVTRVAVGVEGSNAKGVLCVDDLSLYRTAPPSPQEELWIEAEAVSSITAPMAIMDDPLASGGRCIGTDSTHADSQTAPPATGVARIPFTVAGGTYRVASRILIPGDNNSVWMRVADGKTQTKNDASGWVCWNDMAAGAAWHWDDIKSSNDSSAVVQWTLGQGSHILEIAYREAGAQVDVIVIRSVN